MLTKCFSIRCQQYQLCVLRENLIGSNSLTVTLSHPLTYKKWAPVRSGDNATAPIQWRHCWRVTYNRTIGLILGAHSVKEIYTQASGGSSISQTGGQPKPMIWRIFAENCMKTKTFWPGERPLRHPLPRSANASCTAGYWYNFGVMKRFVFFLNSWRT